MMTACGGERRFASTVAKRLQALGALTSGDRRAADASDLSAFDVDTEWGLAAMRKVVQDVSTVSETEKTPPVEGLRSALGLKLQPRELQRQWSEYLEEANEALFAVEVRVRVRVRVRQRRERGQRSR